MEGKQICEQALEMLTECVSAVTRCDALQGLVRVDRCSSSDVGRDVRGSRIASFPGVFTTQVHRVLTHHKFTIERACTIALSALLAMDNGHPLAVKTARYSFCG